MMAAIPVPLDGPAGSPPEWIHLLPAPADGLVQTGDKRGPYTLAPMAEIIAATFSETDAFEIDINHATYHSAPKGGRSDAMGWVSEMQERADGLWGRVEWTEEGARLVKGRAYKGISPVVIHDENKKITRLANASLVNHPNLRGLRALHAEEYDMVPKWLADMLGLADDATEDQARAALKKKMGGGETTAAQAQLVEIGTALGLAADADGAAILAAAKTFKSPDAAPAEITALQAELTTLTTELNTIKETGARNAAETFVDGQIKLGRVGVKPLRDRYIAMHMKDPAGTVELLGAMPVLTGSSITALPPAAKDGKISLNAEQLDVARQLGMSAEDYAAELKAQNEGEDA